jgi:hypothetical protein
MAQNVSAQWQKSGASSAQAPEMLSRPTDTGFVVPLTSVRRVEADGIQVFYREAGNPQAPVVLLLHGFPSCIAS